MQTHYNQKILTEAIAKSGVKEGDIVFCHSNIGYFGIPEEGRDTKTICSLVLNAFMSVLGETGTFVSPTFTYSFGSNSKDKVFDPDNTPSGMGVFAEMVRRHPRARRSVEPMFSVAALGRQAEELVNDVSDECFGKDSFWDRFLQGDGRVCNLNFDAASTFIHYVEKQLGVPYRSDRIFKGILIRKGVPEEKSVTFFCRDINDPDTDVYCETFDAIAKKDTARVVKVGRGAVVSLSAADTYALIKREIAKDLDLLIKRGK
jgi:aminoglycoside 3-N-acetyltransferase